MGPNGAGKSTLGNVLMGNPVYELTDGKIFFDGSDITEESVDKRAKAGIFLSFQNPLEIQGISLETFIRSALQQKTGERVKLFQFQKELQANMKLLNMADSYAKRDLNVGFSGGERKKSEILQLLMLKPKFAILDETDSGLDVDAVRTVSKGIEEYQKTQNGGLLIITHSTRILESLKVDYVHILVHGSIVKTGDSSLIDEINENGFDAYLK
jgi:Fe-S cluster assembly ATP-binding protein